MPFLALSFDLGSRDAEQTEQACFDTGALSVTLADARDDAVLEPAPGEIRLWPATRVQALYAADAAAPALIAALCTRLGVVPAQIEARSVADRAWEREWLADFHCMRFGERLWVCPRHESCPDPRAIVVRLDPGLAFGTGTHESTALCLEWLDGQELSGRIVIDYGCGSGILAIAAAKLGARAVYAFDIDPQALLATHENATDNAVGDCVHVCESEAMLPRGGDILLANILAGAHCTLAARYGDHVHPGGHLVLAGILDSQAQEVTAACTPWFDMTLSGRRNGWLALTGTRHACAAIR
jgi:ribosomal protein L11 methyltransferase